MVLTHPILMTSGSLGGRRRVKCRDLRRSATIWRDRTPTGPVVRAQVPAASVSVSMHDRARVSLDRHATYIVFACLAGAAR